jgi:hypothetical protein
MSRSRNAAGEARRDLARIGVTVVTVREPWTEADGPARDLLVAVMSWVSGFERQRLIERVHAGLARARREGKRLGRPVTRPAPVLVTQLREGGPLVAAGGEAARHERHERQEGGGVMTAARRARVWATVAAIVSALSAAYLGG